MVLSTTALEALNNHSAILKAVHFKSNVPHMEANDHDELRSIYAKEIGGHVGIDNQWIRQLAAACVKDVGIKPEVVRRRSDVLISEEHYNALQPYESILNKFGFDELKHRPHLDNMTSKAFAEIYGSIIGRSDCHGCSRHENVDRLAVWYFTAKDKYESK